MKKIIFIYSFISLISTSIFAQSNNRAITTAVPFLLVSGDARASGMGDIGVTTSTDAFSQQWNAAKYAFAREKQGVGFSYVPYLRELVTDINLGVLTYYNRINERSAVAGSLRYFGLGGIELRNSPNQQPIQAKPNEFSIDLSYALRMSNEFSMSVTGKFIRSDLEIPGTYNASDANTFATDIGAYYQGKEMVFEKFNGRIRAGLNISNIGPKVKYDVKDQDNFLPTNFKLGTGFDFILDASNTISAYGEINKLLVPTPSDSNKDGKIDSNDKWYNEGPISAIFSSWSDAPDGFNEELKEFTWALGAEYWYEDSFAFRMGYFSETREKGFRKFFTLGAGFKYSTIRLDTSYLFSATRTATNPLEGSLRFSLTFNFGDTYKD